MGFPILTAPMPLVNWCLHHWRSGPHFVIDEAEIGELYNGERFRDYVDNGVQNNPEVQMNPSVTTNGYNKS